VAHFERRKGRGTMNEADYFDGDTESALVKALIEVLTDLKGDVCK
jgi:hypothetical protein